MHFSVNLIIEIPSAPETCAFESFIFIQRTPLLMALCVLLIIKFSPPSLYNGMPNAQRSEIGKLQVAPAPIELYSN